jgi:hypothetical protein
MRGLRAIHVVGITETWTRNQEHVSGGEVPVFSEYCLRVINRYLIDPWARLQGPSVSGLGEDPVSRQVGRPEGTDWIVCPIVIGLGVKGAKPKLWGYLSADKVTDPSSDQHKRDYDNENERNWMECGLSVVAVALSSALQSICGIRLTSAHARKVGRSRAKTAGG